MIKKKRMIWAIFISYCCMSEFVAEDHVTNTLDFTLKLSSVLGVLTEIHSVYSAIAGLTYVILRYMLKQGKTVCYTFLVFGLACITCMHVLTRL